MVIILCRCNIQLPTLMDFWKFKNVWIMETRDIQKADAGPFTSESGSISSNSSIRSVIGDIFAIHDANDTMSCSESRNFARSFIFASGLNPVHRTFNFGSHECTDSIFVVFPIHGPLNSTWAKNTQEYLPLLQDPKDLIHWSASQQQLPTLKWDQWLTWEEEIAHAIWKPLIFRLIPNLISGSTAVISSSNFDKIAWSATKSTSFRERARNFSFTCYTIFTKVLCLWVPGQQREER